MFLLLYLEDRINAFVNIIRGFDRRRQVEHRLPSYEGFFMVVLNLHIDNMYNAIEFTPSGEQVIADGVKTPFLTCDHDVRYCLAVLPSFWGEFDVSISVKHL